jgi:hypothetical protein
MEEGGVRYRIYQSGWYEVIDEADGPAEEEKAEEEKAEEEEGGGDGATGTEAKEDEEAEEEEEEEADGAAGTEEKGLEEEARDEMEDIVIPRPWWEKIRDPPDAQALSSHIAKRAEEERELAELAETVYEAQRNGRYYKAFAIIQSVRRKVDTMLDREGKFFRKWQEQDATRRADAAQVVSRKDRDSWADMRDEEEEETEEEERRRREEEEEGRREEERRRREEEERVKRLKPWAEEEREAKHQKARPSYKVDLDDQSGDDSLNAGAVDTAYTQGGSSSSALGTVLSSAVGTWVRKMNFPPGLSAKIEGFLMDNDINPSVVFANEIKRAKIGNKCIWVVKFREDFVRRGTDAVGEWTSSSDPLHYVQGMHGTSAEAAGGILRDGFMRGSRQLPQTYFCGWKDGEGGLEDGIELYTRVSAGGKNKCGLMFELTTYGVCEVYRGAQYPNLTGTYWDEYVAMTRGHIAHYKTSGENRWAVDGRRMTLTRLWIEETALDGYVRWA